MKKIILAVLFPFCYVFTLQAQENRLHQSPTSSSQIYQNMEKLGFLGSALFIAAHPDDENTRLISWLDNEKMARTAYLSLTRGDGGQNLIGPELREQLGMIRTQELLEARNIDGGEQFFTRANDFGYSKHPDETLQIWEKDEVLADVVRIIRQFQPDVIVNRFDHRSPGSTHGHHTSSAMLSVEAFDLVNDKSAFPEQLETLDTWQPQRLFFNTSWWFYGSEDAFAKADKTNLYEVESGTYFPETGLSNGEIAALSRSRHQSQGFGSSGSRGAATEYLEFLKGSRPANKTDIFSGINTTWSRIDDSGHLEKDWQKLLAEYDFKNPSASVNQLVRLHILIDALEDSYWKKVKLKEVTSLIAMVQGIYVQAYSNQPYATGGEKLPIRLEISNRSNNTKEFTFDANDSFQWESQTPELGPNESETFELKLQIPENHFATSPYYLDEPGTLGMYKVKDPSLIGQPEAEADFQVIVRQKFAGATIEYVAPVVYKTTDRVRGEVYEPFVVVPEVAVSIENPVYIFSNKESKEINVTIKAFKNVSGYVSLKQPEGWEASILNSNTPVSIEKGQQITQTFTVQAPDNSDEGDLEVGFISGEKTFNQEVIEIDYDHIPNQQLVRKASAQLVNPGLRNLAETVAYINGAGDDVAQAIEAIGSKVFKFDPGEVPADLSKYDAVVVGIRAFNVAPEEMANLQSQLDSYVKNGGTLVMQYNTNRGVPNDALGPLGITLSRKRVTDENAPVTFLNPEHKVLQSPNAITEKDFEGWVQERGLYFPEAWDPAFKPILGMNDPGEAQTQGSLIVAEYGKGHIAYTGLSLFRELPAGVSGAYKLLANMISLSKKQPTIEKPTRKKL